MVQEMNWKFRPYGEGYKDKEISEDFGDNVRRMEEIAHLRQAQDNAARTLKRMELGNQLGEPGIYREVVANQFADDAKAVEREQDFARIKELQDSIAERKSRLQNDPRMQIAAMMAMGGQPGALQSLLVSSVQQDLQKVEKEKALKKDAQSKMDALENSINTDLMYLAGMNKDQRAKALSVSIPLFKAKMQELLDAGATSRMGGLAAWEKLFEQFKTSGKLKDDKAAEAKAHTQSLLNKIKAGK